LTISIDEKVANNFGRFFDASCVSDKHFVLILVKQLSLHVVSISVMLLYCVCILLTVKHPREAALDAQCCASIANLGKQKAQALSTGFGSFSISEFAEKLVRCSY